MQIRSVSSFFLFAALLVGDRREEAVRDFSRTVTLGAGEKVMIDNRFGEVRVRGQAQKEATIKAVIKVQAASQEEAKKWAGQVEVKVDQGGGMLSVRTTYPERKSDGWGNNLSFSVSYDISMPESSPLEVTNKFGATSVSGVKGDLTIRNSHGSVVARNGRGKWLIENGFASVEALSNQGEVTVNTSHGKVTVNDAGGSVSVRNRFAAVHILKAAKDLRVTNQNGEVEARSVGGPAEVNTSFAAVRLEDISGAVTVNNRNGEVRLRGVGAGARVDTSFAGVTIEDAAGPIDVVDKNGRVQVSGLKGKCAPVYLKTAFGAIKVSLPSGASYNASAKTSFGSITSDAGSVSKDGNRQTLSVKFGAGECEMNLTTHHGAIEIRK